MSLFYTCQRCGHVWDNSESSGVHDCRGRLPGEPFLNVPTTTSSGTVPVTKSKWTIQDCENFERGIMSKWGQQAACPQGWQCPVCKSVFAPWNPRCDKCGEKR